MSGLQKWILVAGLLVVGLSSRWAPYSYTGHWTLSRLTNSCGVTSDCSHTGTLYAPLWDAPSQSDVRNLFLGETGHDWIEDATVTLQAGKLGLIWGAIAGVTIVVVLVAAPNRNTGRAQT